MKSVSVIIPVYNSEKYLSKCIDSLLNQTLDNMEFIFVNDGSTDKSKKIIEDYMKNDKRIILFNKDNGGQGSARNLGLKNACGEYIAFLDSDDYVSFDMYKKLYDRAKLDDLDIVICNYFLEYKDRVVKNINNMGSDKEKVLTTSQYIISTPSPWNKIIKKEYIDKVNFCFPEGIIYEDLASIPLLGLNNPSVLYINECLHYYVQSEGSTIRNSEYKSKYEDIFEAIDYLYSRMFDKGYNKELEYLITYHFLYLGSLNFYKFKKYSNIHKISNYMKKYFPKWYKNDLVKLKFTKKQIIYMQLFFHKYYFIISVYRRFMTRNEIN